MAIYPKATSELNIFNDDVGDAISPPDFINTKRTMGNISEVLNVSLDVNSKKLLPPCIKGGTKDFCRNVFYDI